MFLMELIGGTIAVFVHSLFLFAWVAMKHDLECAMVPSASCHDTLLPQSSDKLVKWSTFCFVSSFLLYHVYVCAAKPHMPCPIKCSLCCCQVNLCGHFFILW